MTTFKIGRVMWNNKYSHVVDFQTETQRREWFNSNFATLNTTVKLFERETGHFEVLDLTYNEMLLQGFNYLYVIEEDEKLGRNIEWFAFITAITRTNRDTCIIKYEVDYWQTYFFKPNGEKAVVDILDAFVKREHQDRWTKSGDSLYPIWSRTIENIETGDMIATEQTKITYPVYKEDGTIWDEEELRLTPYLVFYDINSIGSSHHYSFINEISQPINVFILFKISGTMFRHTPYYKENNTLYRLAVYYGDLAYELDEDYGNMKAFMTNNEHIYAIKKANYLPFNFIASIENDGQRDILTFKRKTIGNQTFSLQPHKYKAYIGDAYALRISYINTQNTPNYIINPYYITHTPTINDDININYEPKLKTQEFELYKITSIKSEVLNLLNENIENIGCSIIIGNSLDIWNYDELKLEGYNNDDLFYRLRTKNNNELVLSNDNYLNYMINNRNQIQTQQNLNASKTAIGVVSVIGGIGLIGSSVVSGGGGIGMGLGLIAGGVSGIVSGANGIAQEQAKQTDHKNKVDDVKSNENTLMCDIKDDSDYYRLMKYEIRDIYKDKVHTLFTKQGYLTNEHKPPILNSRYYFNYIHCTYVEINPIAIPQDAVRKIIESMYLNGLTIWHYRNANTFRFLDYTKENWEMSLL